jgi:hypothetical protein
MILFEHVFNSFNFIYYPKIRNTNINRNNIAIEPSTKVQPILRVCRKQPSLATTLIFSVLGLPSKYSPQCLHFMAFTLISSAQIGQVL